MQDRLNGPFHPQSRITTSRRTPIIKARDQAWENNYGSKEKHSEKEPLDDHGVHMPDRSWTPLNNRIRSIRYAARFAFSSIRWLVG